MVRNNRVGHWGDCKLDRETSRIASPYPYKTAAEHYAALMAEAQKARRPDDAHASVAAELGRTVSSRRAQANSGSGVRNLQTSTMLSLLTPEYQKRMVQQNYHEVREQLTAVERRLLLSRRVHAVVGAGFPRRDDRGHGDTRIRSSSWRGSPTTCSARCSSASKHVQEVPQWYGETIGFWNGNTLVTWTANVQAWTLSHSMFEYSGSMEVVERFIPSADGKTITVEATFYDPEAFTRPLHTVTPWEFARGADDPEARHTFVECRVQSTIVNGPDGRPTQLTFLDDGYIDYFGRPWAQNWERHFEQGWERPEK